MNIVNFEKCSDAQLIGWLGRHFASEGVNADAETLSALISRVKKVAAHLKDALPCDGFNILQNNGEAAGQTVMHIHFHIVPRYGKEEISFISHEGDMDELKALAEKIRMS